jgi:hypothetical protein
MNWHTLKTACNDLYTAELDAGIKQAIDDKLSLGWQRDALWPVLQWFLFEAGCKDWQLVYLAVHAYLFPDRDDVPGYPEKWVTSGPPHD